MSSAIDELAEILEVENPKLTLFVIASPTFCARKIKSLMQASKSSLLFSPYLKILIVTRSPPCRPPFSFVKAGSLHNCRA